MKATDDSDHALPASGTWLVTLREAVPFGGRMHDVILQWRRRDGVWDREAVALTPTMVSSLHEFRVRPASGNAPSADRPARVEADGRIDPDPWAIVAGPLRVTLAIERWDDLWAEGTYEGSFAGSAIAGRVAGRYEPATPPSRGADDRPLEILAEFERPGPAGRLYDFSHAGRDTTDPTVDLPVIDATDFGLRPDSGRDATEAIQAALDAAGAAGGAVVQLPAGVLDVSVDRKMPPLRIRSDRVVLRGAGSGPDGTLLVNHRYSDTPEPGKPWLAGLHPLLIIAPEDQGEPVPVTAVVAGRRGEAWIDVADASPLAVGQPVLLRQLESPDGSLARDLVQGQVEVADNWRGDGRELVSQLASVMEIDGVRVRLDAPLHRDVTRWRAELCRLTMLTGASVANLRMRGLWGGYFVHHKNGEHDNGWDQVKFRRVRAGWADDLLHENTTSALALTDCLGCRVRRCRIAGNPGHNGFVLNGRSTGNLLRDCHAGRNMHGFNVQGTISGNAVVDCSMDEPSGIDLHGGIGCDNLFDALVGGINKGGGSASAVPPRHGPGLVLWNWSAGQYNPYKPWMCYTRAADHDTTPGFIAVGVHGQFGQPVTYGTPDGDASGELRESWGWVESPHQRVAPRSLYAWQRRRCD